MSNGQYGSIWYITRKCHEQNWLPPCTYRLWRSREGRESLRQPSTGLFMRQYCQVLVCMWILVSNTEKPIWNRVAPNTPGTRGGGKMANLPLVAIIDLEWVSATLWIKQTRRHLHFMPSNQISKPIMFIRTPCIKELHRTFRGLLACPYVHGKKDIHTYP